MIAKPQLNTQDKNADTALQHLLTERLTKELLIKAKMLLEAGAYRALPHSSLFPYPLLAGQKRLDSRRGLS